MADNRRRNPKQKEEESLWKQALTRDSEWKKEDLENVVYWARQILGFIVGVIWGVIPLYGMVGIASFGLVNALVLFIYYTKYLGVDDEEYGRFELIQEGFFSSFSVFLVMWIITYNLIYIG